MFVTIASVTLKTCTMKLSDFILLSKDEKKHAVIHEGVLISKRKTSDSFAFLFQVENYYVEACFNAQNKAIEEFRVSDKTTLLNPYLESIIIDDLLN